MGPVLNQGQQGSCTAHSECADREYLHWQALAEHGHKPAPTAIGMFSPSFTYYQERYMDGSLNQGDCGSQIRTSCKVGQLYGNGLRSEMPYNDQDYSTAPTATQLADALKFPTGSYHAVGNVDDMKSVIASEYNLKLGFQVYESFESPQMGRDGIWSPDPANEQVLGGHAVLAIGYDDSVNGGSFLVRNSWGAGWGDKGNFWLRYKDAANALVVTDIFTQHLGRWA
jgi:C1A family cysteine protease